MADEPRTVMQQLTDTTAAGPDFFIAAIPWTRLPEEGMPKPVRRLTMDHTTQTLADYTTLDQLNSYVSMGYNSLLIGQRIGLMEAGEVIAAWPIDNTGWPWSRTKEEDTAWAFRTDPNPGYLRGPSTSKGIIVANGTLTEVIRAAEAESTADPEATIVIARQCFFQPHWH